MNSLYTSDIPPSKAWSLLQEKSDAYLIDVRTIAEWKFVGIPNLDSLNKDLITIEWRTFPNMEINPNFANDLEKLVSDKNATLIFLCRTGGRSAESATRMHQIGYKNCYNVETGFEGALDTNSHRGLTDGWKASNLPWRQF